MIDHRNAGANQPPEEMIRAGLPAHAGRGLFEAATVTCHGCQRQMLRIEPKEYCKKHDRFSCAGCAARARASGICRSFKEVVEIAQEAALKGLPFKSPFQRSSDG